MSTGGFFISDDTPGLTLRHELHPLIFYQILKAGERLSEFNFRKLPAGENIFHVDVSDDRGQRVFFTMKKEGANWRINEEDKPDWLYPSEGLLGEALKEQV